MEITINFRIPPHSVVIVWPTGQASNGVVISVIPCLKAVLCSVHRVLLGLLFEITGIFMGGNGNSIRKFHGNGNGNEKE